MRNRLRAVSEDKRALVERALGGQPGAVRTLIDLLTPVIQARVARALVRSSVRRRSDRSARQELEDVTQEVFVSLFDAGGRALRAWDPERGLSLANFVGLLAERQVASILRSGKRSPWTEEPAELGELDAASEALPEEPRVESRELLGRLLERMQAELSPRGLELFSRLIVEQQSVEAVVAQTGMKPDAVYAWRSRLKRMAHRLAADLAREQLSDRVEPPRISGRDASA